MKKLLIILTLGLMFGVEVSQRTIDVTITNGGSTSLGELFSEYNFMHNKIPDIKHVYRPHGFLEFQPLIPKKDGSEKLKELLILCQHFGSESLLCGMKAHKADDYLISYEGDGYSIGVDIQIGGRSKDQINQFTKAQDRLNYRPTDRVKFSLDSMGIKR